MLRHFAHEVAAFFRTAVFTSFFRDKTAPVSARFGLAFFGMMAVSNAFVAYLLATQQQRLLDMITNKAPLSEIESLTFLFIAIFVWLFIVEPLNEVAKLFFFGHWVKVAMQWYSNLFAMVWRLVHGGDPPDRISERIAERIPELVEAVITLYCSCCRAIISFTLFAKLAFTISALLTPGFSLYVWDWLLVPGWLLWTVILTSVIETAGAAWIGRNLPGKIETSRVKKGDYRALLEDYERLHSVRYSDRTSFTANTGVAAATWIRVYMHTLPDTYFLLMWKNANQQAWQYILIVMLFMHVAAGNFTLGTAGAAVYCINELRGALLTFANVWPIVAKMQALASGLRQVEHYAEKPPLAEAILRDAAE
jgi:ABC-type long-subunit fatty acid transport system fused permease/ATPase subunit